MSARVNEWSFAVGQSHSNIYHRQRDGYEWYEGNLVTPLGFVSVYTDDRCASYAFIWRGRKWYFSEYRGRTPRGLAIAAGKFARRIVRENPVEGL